VPVKSFNEPGTGENPSAVFRSESNRLEFHGKAVSSNPDEFFSRYLKWSRAYFEDPHKKEEALTIEFKLTQIKSHTQNYLRDFLLQLAILAEQHKNTVIIIWLSDVGDNGVEKYGDLLKEVIQSILDQAETTEKFFKLNVGS